MRYLLFHQLFGFLTLCLLHMQCNNPNSDSISKPSQPNSTSNSSQFYHTSDPHLTKVLQELKAGNTKNINSQDEDSNTAMHLATKELRIGKDERESLQLLLKNNANGNIQNNEGETALMVSLKYNQYSNVKAVFSITKELADTQTDFTLKDNEGNHPLHFAASIFNTRRRKDIVVYILQRMKATINTV